MVSQLDFRRLVKGLGGQRNKKKRVVEERQEEEGGGNGIDMEIEDFSPLVKRPAIAGDGYECHVFGRPTYDGTIAGKVFGRKWKNPKFARTSSIKVSLKKPSLEQQNRQNLKNKGFGHYGKNFANSLESHGVDKRKSGTFGPLGSNTVPLGKCKSFLKGNNWGESETKDWVEPPHHDHGVSSQLKRQDSHQDGSQRWGERFNHGHFGYLQGDLAS
ncbi:hypothetical protein L7F22_013809 [Adiantum nelumboides]|nr:hypothetical protein [Adiantum nelumboides]